jgi:hypothetical protein
MRCIVLANVSLCFLVIMHWWIFNWQISFLYFSFIGLMQCSKTLSVISSTDWERTIRAMKFHQYLSLGPLRRIHFHFAKYSSLLIQCTTDLFI